MIFRDKDTYYVGSNKNDISYSCTVSPTPRGVSAYMVSPYYSHRLKRELKSAPTSKIFTCGYEIDWIMERAMRTQMSREVFDRLLSAGIIAMIYVRDTELNYVFANWKQFFKYVKNEVAKEDSAGKDTYIISTETLSHFRMANEYPDCPLLADYLSEHSHPVKNFATSFSVCYQTCMKLFNNNQRNIEKLISMIDEYRKGLVAIVDKYNDGLFINTSLTNRNNTVLFFIKLFLKAKLTNSNFGGSIEKILENKPHIEEKFDVMLDMLKEEKVKNENRYFSENQNKLSLQYEDDEYKIYVPQSRQELSTFGQYFNNCLNGHEWNTYLSTAERYVVIVVDKETDTPVVCCDIDVDTNHIIQYLGKNNSTPKVATTFRNEYQEYLSTL